MSQSPPGQGKIPAVAGPGAPVAPTAAPPPVPTHLGQNTSALSGPKPAVDPGTDPTRILRAGMGGAAPGVSVLPQVKGYEILEELGRGGMGVVYKAWQKSLERPVALKMVLAGAFATDSDIERFRTEAIAVARLRHPYLLSIYEIGDQDGLPFFSMEYCDGGSLTRYLRGRPQPARAAAHLLQKLALAMDYAHKQGVIHRDLKPANILFQKVEKIEGSERSERPRSGDSWLTAYGSADPENTLAPDAFLPKITDFGLAKRLNADNFLTRTGDILGTPAYMAPEQAAGRNQEIGPATDIYSLGAILYELITGHALFHGATPAETILKVTQEEPVAPRKFNRAIPADLETICLKCLEKSPGRRYPTAADLADDLGRFLQGEPILARKASVFVRAVKWTKRHPAKATLAAASVLILLLGVGWLWQSAKLARVEAEAAQLAESERAKALLETRRMLAEAVLDRGIFMAERGDTARGLQWMLQSLDILTLLEGKTEAAAPLANAARRSLSGWARSVSAKPVLLTHNGWAYAVAFSPDGKYAVTGGEDRITQVWDAVSGKPLGASMRHDHGVFGVVFEPRGRFLFTVGGFKGGGPGELRVFERTDNPDEPFRLYGPAIALPVVCKSILVDDEGKRVITLVGRNAFVWDFNAERGGNGLNRVAVISHGETIMGAAFLRDGTIVTAGLDKLLAVWDGRKDKPLKVVLLPGAATALALRGDGKLLAIGCDLAPAADAETQKVDGAPARGGVILIEPATGDPGKKTEMRLLLHRGRIKTIAFSADGQLLASSSFLFDEGKKATTFAEVRLWQADPRTPRLGQPVGVPMPHDEQVWALAFTADGKQLLTGCRDRAARLWSVAEQRLISAPVVHEGNVVNVALHPRLPLALTASAGGPPASARLWDLPRAPTWGQPLFHPSDDPKKKDGLAAFAWESDGEHVWTAGERGKVVRWQPALGAGEAPVQLPTKRRVTDLAVVHGDQALLALCDDGSLLRWNIAARRLDFSPAPVQAIPPGGASLVLSGERASFWLVYREAGVLQKFSVQTGEKMGDKVQLEPYLSAVAFSADGKWLASACNLFDPLRAKVVLRSAQTFEVVKEWEHGGSILALLFTPDNARLITAGEDRLAQTWDLQTGKLFAAPLLHDSSVLGMTLSPDGRILATGCLNGPIRLWDLGSGRSIGPGLFPGHTVRRLAFRPDGSVLMFASERDGAALCVPVPQPVEGTVERLRAWIESVTGMELAGNEIVQPLTMPALTERRARLRDLGGAP